MRKNHTKIITGGYPKVKPKLMSSYYDNAIIE